MEPARVTRTKKQVLTDPILRKTHRHNKVEWDPVECPKCGGWGYIKHIQEHRCDACQGEGVIYSDR